MKSKKYILLVFMTLFLSFNLMGQNNSFLDIGNEFFPAGFMGCTDKIDINPAFTTEPHSAPICYKIEFLTSCGKGFAGVFWTNIADDDGANWGQYPGTDFSKRGFSKITFWAKGKVGNEVVEFGSGGIDNTLKEPEKFKYKDNYKKKYSTEGKNVVLTNNWKQYSINLTKEDLSSVIGGFYWAVNWRANPTGVIFYLDDINFE